MAKESIKITLILGVAAVLCVLEIIRELHTFKMTHYTVDSPKLTGEETKFILLSDLHNKVYGRHNKRLLSAIAKQRPAAILIAGDMLVGKKGVSPQPALEFVKSLANICPVFYANGNHEQRMKEKPEEYGRTYERYKKALCEEQVIFLENRSVVREWNGDLFTISGLEIPYEGYAKRKYHRVTVAEIEQRIGRASRASYQILIAHNPTHVPAYREWKADLVVAGHFHGGLVRVPFFGAVITPQLKIFPRYSGGIYREGQTTTVVSRGIGEHTIPIRLFNTPEVVVLHMKGRR